MPAPQCMCRLGQGSGAAVCQPRLLPAAAAQPAHTPCIDDVRLPPSQQQDPDADIRQSGFALVGDLAKACAPHIKPALVSQ